MNKFLVVKVRTSKFKKMQAETQSKISSVPGFISAIMRKNMNGYCWSNYSTYSFICTFDLAVLKRVNILKSLKGKSLEVIDDWKEEGFY